MSLKEEKKDNMNRPPNDKNIVPQAIALEYNPDDAAPKVIAMGKGALAERIIQQARDNAVPVHQDDKLARTLSKLEIGDMIPPELYQVVAEILLFVDNMDKIKAKLENKRNVKMNSSLHSLEKGKNND